MKTSNTVRIANARFAHLLATKQAAGDAEAALDALVGMARTSEEQLAAARSMRELATLLRAHAAALDAYADGCEAHLLGRVGRVGGLQ